MVVFAGIGYTAAVAAAAGCIVLDPTNVLCIPLVLLAIAAMGDLMDRAKHYISDCTDIADQIAQHVAPKCADFLEWIAAAPEWMWDQDGSAVAVVNAALNWCSEMGGGGS
jgi:hypothetical protein